MPADEIKPDANAKPEEPKAPPMTDAEHHAILAKRYDVVAVKPARTVNGKHFPEERENVKMVSLRCALAHRVLHGMSPDEVKKLRATFDAKKPLGKDEPDDQKRAEAFEQFALRHIEQNFETEIDGKAVIVPDQNALATQEHLALFAPDEHVVKHRAKALSKLAAS